MKYFCNFFLRKRTNLKYSLYPLKAFRNDSPFVAVMKYKNNFGFQQ